MIPPYALGLIILISYASLYVGRLLGRWSGQELAYQKFRWSYVSLFLFLGLALFASYGYAAIILIAAVYLLFRTSYVFYLSGFLLGLGLLFSPDPILSANLTIMFHLLLGAVWYVQKKGAADTFRKSTGFITGAMIAFLWFLASSL